MSFAYRVSGTFLMDAGRRRLVQTEALLGCTIVRALRSLVGAAAAGLRPVVEIMFI
jgi:pyruvate/2-oxoglutarate/acetoin dehydrogenase E1 component